MRIILVFILALLAPLSASSQMYSRLARGGSTTLTGFSYPGVVGLVNMFAAGNSFSDGNWIATNVGNTAFSTTVLSPDGVTTSAKLQASTTNGYHSIGQGIIRSGGVATYREVVTAKKDDLSRLTLAVANTASFATSTNGATATFDLNAGAVAIAPSAYGTGFTAVSASINNIGNGSYQCILDVTASATTIYGLIALDNGSGNGASSKSFAGTGTNGVYIWQANFLPTAAWSLTNNTFYDSMSDSTKVDLSNSKSGGYNWYVNSNWTGYSYGSYGFSSDYTFSPTSGVTVSQDRSTFGMSLITVAPSGGSYIGKVFVPPFYAETKLAFDQANAINTPTPQASFPAFWSIPTEALVATGMTVTQTETDFFEAYPVANGCVGPPCSTSPGPISTVRNWQVGDPNTGEDNNNNASYPAGVIWTNLNRYGTLWITQALNGGVGLYLTFLNGQYLPNSEVAYGSSMLPLPGTYTAAPVGAYSHSDNMHYPMILGAGCLLPMTTNCAAGWPATFKDVRVFQIAHPAQ